MDIKKQFQNLQKKFLNKKFNDVLENSKNLLKKFPQKIFLLNIIGLSFYFLNKNSEAIFYFKKAIKIDNNNYVIKINLANTLTNIGNYEEAEPRSRSNLEPHITRFGGDPHDESAHIEKLFWGPVSVTLDKIGRLYVTESNRHRVQIYERMI